MPIDFFLPRKPLSARQLLRNVLYDKETTVEVIQESYLSWVRKNEYMIFQREIGKTVHRIASLCPKRGNIKYAYRTKKRFNELALPFKLEAENNNQQILANTETVKETSVLFVTLTVNPSIMGYKTAWKTIGEHWNRYLANLRHKYGNLHIGRTWESMRNGYPHIHAIIQFLDRSFDTFLLYSKKQKKAIWRIEDINQQKIKTAWRIGNVDVQGMVNLYDGLRYLGKYVTKASDLSLNDQYNKGLKTLALTWAFGKRCFSFGKKFRESILQRYISSKILGDLTRKVITQTFSEQMTIKEVPLRESQGLLPEKVFEKWHIEDLLKKSGLGLGAAYQRTDSASGFATLRWSIHPNTLEKNRLKGKKEP
jgi:hypothetical protein